MKIRKCLISLSIVFASLLSMVGVTVSWLGENESVVPDIIGETGRQYFDVEFDSSGTTIVTDGSEAHPFYITRPVHFYNLSKLQNAGALQSHNYYFQIGKPTSSGATTLCTYGTDESDTCVHDQAIDMTTRVIEPIGTDAIPFRSVLHGNGIAIKNLVVENPVTDTGSLYTDVGVFGVIEGETNTSTGAISGGRVYDMPFSNLTIKSLNNSSNITIGLVAGNVKGGIIDNIGVHNGVIEPTFQSESDTTIFTSAYSLIGTKSDGVGMETNPGAGGEAGGPLWLNNNDIHYTQGISEILGGKYESVSGAINGSIYLTGQMRVNIAKNVMIKYSSSSDTYTYVYNNSTTLSTSALFGTEDATVVDRISDNLYQSMIDAGQNPDTDRLASIRLNSEFGTSRVVEVGKDKNIYQRAIYLSPISSGHMRFLMVPDNAGKDSGAALYRDEGEGNVTELKTFTTKTLAYFTYPLVAGEEYYMGKVSNTESAFITYIEFDGINQSGGGTSGTIANIDFTYGESMLPSDSGYVTSNILFGFTNYRATYSTPLAFDRSSSSTFVVSAPVYDFYTLYGGNSGNYTQSTNADGSVSYTYNGT